LLAQAARKKAEEMLQASVAAEVESRNKVEEVANKRQQEQRLVEDERAAIKRVGCCCSSLLWNHASSPYATVHLNNSMHIALEYTSYVCSPM
jgi:hypothetical protein